MQFLNAKHDNHFELLSLLKLSGSTLCTFGSSGVEYLRWPRKKSEGVIAMFIDISVNKPEQSN